MLKSLLEVCSSTVSDNYSITLLGNLEVLLAAQHHSLQHLMGRHVCLEVSRIPKFAHQLTKPLDQEDHDVPRWPADSLVVFLLQEVVSQRWYIGKCLRIIDNYQRVGIYLFILSLLPSPNKVGSNSYL